MWQPEDIHEPKIVVCPRCSFSIDINDRCPATTGIGRCVELAGHAGWHWTDLGGPGITRWTGLYVVRHACPGRLGINDDWCRKPAGHVGSHNNGRGVSFSDPLTEEEMRAEGIEP